MGNVGETHEVEWEYLCFCICTIVLVKPVAEYHRRGGVGVFVLLYLYYCASKASS